MRVTAVILAAGKGERFRSAISKPLVMLAGRPLLWHCLRTLAAHPAITDIIVVANKINLPYIERIIEKYRIPKVAHLVLGGRRRQDSARNGLGAVDARSEVVVIHDSGRPFIGRRMVSAVIAEARLRGAAVTAVPVKATIKQAVRGGAQGSIVEKTLDRRRLWEIQTPQAFRLGLILQAHKRFWRRDATDDASMVERLGASVGIVMGSYDNIKITTPEDLLIAQALVKEKR